MDCGVTPRPRIGLSLTIDHQAVDDAPGGRCPRELVGNLEIIVAETRPLFGD